VAFVQDPALLAGDPVALMTDPQGQATLQAAIAALRHTDVPVFAVGADAGGGPHVKVFDGAGNLKQSFFAYDGSFLGGVRVAFGQDPALLAGDPVALMTDPQGQATLQAAIAALRHTDVPVFAVGADAGGGPHVKVFDGAGNLKQSFFAYDGSFLGGVRVAVG